MKHFNTTFASIISIVAILSVMAILAISSYKDTPALQAELCSDQAQCDVNLHHPHQPDVGKAPTLAPPRSINALSKADHPLRTPSLGQAVYVQVKTDHSEIEVGWAPGEYMGR